MITRRELCTALALLPASPALSADAPSFRFASIDGGDIELADWRGKPVLVVNTASMCAFTPQYDALQALHERLGDKALVLAVPSDDFGGQELGSEAEVKEFCEANFGLTLPMTEITRVRGRDAHPFYRWAADQGVAPRWNFHKILLDGRGGIAGDFPSSVRPDDPALMAAIQAAM